MFPNTLRRDLVKFHKAALEDEYTLIIFRPLIAEVDNIFGRCTYFIFAEIKDNKIENVEIIENKFANQMGGAGVSAAQFVTEKDLTSYNFGCNIGGVKVTGKGGIYA